MCDGRDEPEIMFMKLGKLKTGVGTFAVPGGNVSARPPGRAGRAVDSKDLLSAKRSSERIPGDSEMGLAKRRKCSTPG